MYRWQTLTLARIESRIQHGPGSVPSLKMVESIRQFLFDIGLPHFPEPMVASPSPSVADDAWIILNWDVDGRDLEARFGLDGFIGLSYGVRHYPHDNTPDAPGHLGRHNLPALVFWLLNGYTVDQLSDPKHAA